LIKIFKLLAEWLFIPNFIQITKLMLKSFVFLSLFSLGFFSAASALPLILKNTSPKSISLVIPDVQNSNLSANSETFLDLPVGQKIYFNHDGRQYLLFEVKPELKDKTIIINELIAKRKKELGLN